MKIYTSTTRFFLLGISLLLLTFGSCRKDMPELDRPGDFFGRNFEEVFEVFWNSMNNNYVFWDIDTTDWDQLYRRYKPLFANMNLNDTADVRRSFTYFKDMTDGLIDGHYAIRFRTPLLQDSGLINPSFQRKRITEEFRAPIPATHFFNEIHNRYLNPGRSRALVNTNQGQRFAVSGTVDNGIVYLYFNAFSLRQLYQASVEYALTLDNFFNMVLDTVQPRGVIIDVRNNPGGAVADLDFLLGRMITEPLHFGYTKSKGNNNRLDHTPWIPARVNPEGGGALVTAPFVVLADQHSGSMAEITALAVKTLPNGHFIGERTWGAMGPLTGNIVFNGGQFATSFMDIVITSSLQFKALDNISYEGVGISPDQTVNADLTALATGQDAQLEAAIEYINTR